MRTLQATLSSFMIIRASINLPHMTDERNRHYTQLTLFGLVFLTGASVMVIELLGTRIIAPFYGGSLYVWSSLISVTMIALAVGYFAGGHLADRYQGRGLSLIISASGLLTLLIPLISRPVLEATDPLGLRFGAFVSALTLFFPSLTGLGMTGPFAIKLATARLSGVGASAGNTYAVSTFGSVAGTLFLGFFLFPRVGSREILMALGLLLVIIGVMVYLYERRMLGQRQGVPALWMGGLVILSVTGFFAQDTERMTGEPSGFRLLSERESLHGWVRVLQNSSKDLRILTSDASVIGADSPSTGKTRLGYQLIVDMIPDFRPDIHKVLLIGQGAGHMAMALERDYGIITDTIEIDPEVVAAAGKYFGFSPTGRQIVGDARYEISKLTGRYDLIIHDCFTGGTEPAHLLTVEAFQVISQLLNDRGIMALNTVAFFDDGQNPALRAIASTVDAVFPYRKIYAAMPGSNFNDFVMLASRSSFEADLSRLNPQKAAWLQQREVILAPGHALALSDDFNPIEHLQLRKSEQYRALTREWLGSDLMVR